MTQKNDTPSIQYAFGVTGTELLPRDPKLVVDLMKKAQQALQEGSIAYVIDIEATELGRPRSYFLIDERQNDGNLYDAQAPDTAHPRANIKIGPRFGAGLGWRL